MFIAPRSAVTSISLSSSLTPTPLTNPYANLTTLSIADYYYIKNNGTCLFPTRSSCLHTLISKLPSNTTVDISHPLNPYTPSNITSNTSAIYTGYTSSGTDMWVYIGILGFILLVGALGLFAICCDVCRTAYGRRAQRTNPSQIGNRRQHGNGLKERFFGWFKKPATSNHNQDAGRGDGIWRSLSTRKPSDPIPATLPPPYIGAGAPSVPEPAVRRPSSAFNAGEMHMPPPIYEMANLDPRHEEHLSGAPRYSWEDPVRRDGRALDTSILFEG